MKPGRRTSVARAAYDGAKQQLLQNRHVEVESRAMMFRTLVTATYHNLELWTAEEKAWKQLEKGHGRLAKRLLSCEIHGMAYYQLTVEEVLCIIGVQRLQVGARLKRQTFLRRLGHNGSHAIWAIVQLERARADAVWQHVAWVKEWPGERLPTADRANWPEW